MSHLLGRRVTLPLELLYPSDKPLSISLFLLSSLWTCSMREGFNPVPSKLDRHNNKTSIRISEQLQLYCHIMFVREHNAKRAVILNHSEVGRNLKI